MSEELCACCYGTGYNNYKNRPVAAELERNLKDICAQVDKIRYAGSVELEKFEVNMLLDMFDADSGDYVGKRE